MLSTENMIGTLSELGLNTYEAKIYLTLISEGISTAKNISNITGIPYGKVYEIINTLSSKGFCIILPSKPIKVQATSPVDAFNTFKKSTHEKFEQIENNVVKDLFSMYNVTKQFAEPKSFFWLLNGRANINRKMEMLIDKSEKEINLHLSENGIKRIVFMKDKLKEAHDRGVTINLSTRVSEENMEDVEYLDFCNIRASEKAMNQMIAVDGAECIIVEPLPDDDNFIHGRDVGIWTVSQSITTLLNSFYTAHYEQVDCNGCRTEEEVIFILFIFVIYAILLYFYILDKSVRGW